MVLGFTVHFQTPSLLRSSLLSSSSLASFILGGCLKYLIQLSFMQSFVLKIKYLVQTKRCILLDFLIIFLLPFGFRCVGNKQRHVFQRICLHFWHWPGLLSDKEVRSGFHIAKRRIEAVNPWSFASLRPPPYPLLPCVTKLGG